MGNSLKFPQVIKNRTDPAYDLAHDPAILLLGIYPKEIKIGYQKDFCSSMLTAALSRVGKIWKQSKCLSMDKWTKKLWCKHTVILYSHKKKKKENPGTFNNMVGPGGHYAK